MRSLSVAEESTAGKERAITASQRRATGGGNSMAVTWRIFVGFVGSLGLSLRAPKAVSAVSALFSPGTAVAAFRTHEGRWQRGDSLARSRERAGMCFSDVNHYFGKKIVVRLFGRRVRRGASRRGLPKIIHFDFSIAFHFIVAIFEIAPVINNLRVLRIHCT